jgi:hypothetical protein
MRYHKSMIIYTFRTFPESDLLRDTFGEVFIFSKLRADLQTFSTLIQQRPNEPILGIAASRSVSVFEAKALNRFNQTGQVSPGSPPEKLYVPNLTSTKFSTSNRPTTSFCNWTMYKIQEQLIAENKSRNFSFAHLNPNDIKDLHDMFFTQP